MREENLVAQEGCARGPFVALCQGAAARKVRRREHLSLALISHFLCGGGEEGEGGWQRGPVSAQEMPGPSVHHDNESVP